VFLERKELDTWYLVLGIGQLSSENNLLVICLIWFYLILLYFLLVQFESVAHDIDLLWLSKNLPSYFAWRCRGHSWVAFHYYYYSMTSFSVEE